MVQQTSGLTQIPGHQSPMVSDQVLLDIPHMEGAMFSIKCMYLKIFDIIQDLDLAAFHLAEYSNGNIQLCDSTNMIPITGLYNMLIATMLSIPSCWDGIRCLKTTPAHSGLQCSFISCLVFIVCVGLSHV